MSSAPNKERRSQNPQGHQQPGCTTLQRKHGKDLSMSELSRKLSYMEGIRTAGITAHDAVETVLHIIKPVLVL